MKRQTSQPRKTNRSPSVDEIVRMTLTAFAVYRLAYLIASDEGPGLPIGARENWGMGLAARLRGKIDARQSTYIGRGLRCVFCVSFWVALVAAIVYPFIPFWLLLWLGLAGMVLFLHRLGN